MGEKTILVPVIEICTNKEVLEKKISNVGFRIKQINSIFF
jgi:hypothetical protein